ncbi:MAG TPA: alkaline phosphatase [Bacteroidales bacterium]|nr:alkaline phosphatase [Bacteroidales bacterium]
MKKLYIPLLMIVAMFFVAAQTTAQNSGEIKYVFLFIGDGMGTNQVFLTEKYNDLTKTEPLIFMNGNWSFGLVKTDCADSNKITDSGAGGTALACGERTRYGMIGEYQGKALESTAEYLHKEKKFKVGIITSVPLNHATPACFYGHEPTRRNFDNFTNDLMESGFEFFAGGGFQLGNADTTKNIYRDFDAIVRKMTENDYKVVYEEAQLRADNAASFHRVVIIDTAIRNRQTALKNVFPEERNSLPFALDFPEYKMQLAKYTEKAQNFLYNDKGFFIMVEGGKIDWACHDNDALAAIHEVNAFNEAIKKAYEFYLMHPKNTLILVTADHETGGLSLGSGQDEYGTVKSNKYSLYIRKLLQQKKSYVFTDKETLKKIQEDAQVGWTTDEHTAAPVGIWAIGHGNENFSGIMKNSDLKARILDMVR